MLPLVFLALAAAAQPDGPRGAPITVTGHRWAPFISPMGEPFRAHTPADDTLAVWFRQADRDHDGLLTADEMIADGARYFSLLDSNHDGQIDPDELASYEYEVAPEIQVMSRTKPAPGTPAPAATSTDADDPDEVLSNKQERRQRRQRETEQEASLGLGGALQGAARYALLDIPEPVAAADSDFDRAITLAEFKAAALARFELLDRAHAGRISLPQLEALRPVLQGDGPKTKRQDNPRDTRIGNPLPPGR